VDPLGGEDGQRERFPLEVDVGRKVHYTIIRQLNIGGFGHQMERGISMKGKLPADLRKKKEKTRVVSGRRSVPQLANLGLVVDTVTESMSRDHLTKLL